MVKFLFDKQNIKVQFFFSLKVYNNKFKKWNLIIYNIILSKYFF